MVNLGYAQLEAGEGRGSGVENLSVLKIVQLETCPNLWVCQSPALQKSYMVANDCHTSIWEVKGGEQKSSKKGTEVILGYILSVSTANFTSRNKNTLDGNSKLKMKGKSQQTSLQRAPVRKDAPPHC